MTPATRGASLSKLSGHLFRLTLSAVLVIGFSTAAIAVDIPPPVKVDHGNRARYAPYVERIAKKYRLESALLDAVISVESAYNPRAVSSAGAMGLMQLMPATAERFGVEDPFDPVANINGGARYLRLLLTRFRNIKLAIAAYHAGEGRVSRHRNTVPPIRATQRYVVSVIHHYMRYKKAASR